VVGLTQSGLPVVTGNLDSVLSATTGPCPVNDGAAHATNFLSVAMSGPGWDAVIVTTTSSHSVNHVGAQSIPLSDTFRGIAVANALPSPVGKYTITVTCQDTTGVNVSGHYSSGIYFLPSGVFVLGATVASKPLRVASSPRNKAAYVSWQAPASFGGLALASYVVTAAPGGRKCTTTGARACTVTGLRNGVAYKFTVRALNALGSSAASLPSAAIVAGTPSLPRTLKATRTSKTALTFTWAPPAYANSSTVRAYLVRWKLKTGAWVAWRSTKLVRKISVRGARTGVFQVRAVNKTGAGPVAGLTFAK
jgi:hypothetical protein